MTLNIKVFDKFYGGTQQRRHQADGKFTLDNLAFLTQDTGDADFEKRKRTVDQWAMGHSYYTAKEDNESTDLDQFFTIDNDPTEGFTLDRVIERYRTNNKLFRVNDPRGFQIEISAENLAELLLNCTVEKGVIKEPLFYGKNASKIALTFEGYPGNWASAGKTAMGIQGAKVHKKIKREKVKVGDWVSSYGAEYLYAGKQPFIVGHKISLSTSDCNEYDYNRVSWNNRYNWRPKNLIDRVNYMELEPYFADIVKQYGNFKNYSTYAEAPQEAFAVFKFTEEEYDVYRTSFTSLTDLDAKTVSLISSGNEVDLSGVVTQSHIGYCQGRLAYQMYKPAFSQDRFKAAMHIGSWNRELLYIDDKYALLRATGNNSI